MNKGSNKSQAPTALSPAPLLGVQREIEETKQAIRPLAEKLERLNRQLADMESRAFIEANKITCADVEMSDGDGKPWFGTVWEFGKWLPAHSKKVWAEWDGRIYHAADLAAGRMPDMPGCTSHLADSSANRGWLRRLVRHQ